MKKVNEINVVKAGGFCRPGGPPDCSNGAYDVRPSVRVRMEALFESLGALSKFLPWIEYPGWVTVDQRGGVSPTRIKR